MTLILDDNCHVLGLFWNCVIDSIVSHVVSLNYLVFFCVCDVFNDWSLFDKSYFFFPQLPLISHHVTLCESYLKTSQLKEAWSVITKAVMIDACLVSEAVIRILVKVLRQEPSL